MSFKNLKNKKILIRDNTGFVGSWLSMILHLSIIDFYGISLSHHILKKKVKNLIIKKIV